MPPTAPPADPGTHVVDHRFGGVAGLVASYLLPGPDGLTLVETGPASTLATLLEGIRAAGFRPADLRRIVVTHVHLDHAGAAGALLRHAPDALVYAHPAGVPHLVDPSRLLRSARRIWGDALDGLWGETLPVPASRVVALADGEEIPAGGRVLRALFTPGHASHHLALHDPAAGAVFTGDVAGVRLQGSSYVRPPTPPPDLDLALWRASVARIRDLRPRRLYLTHFGAFDDPGPHLDELLERLFFWAGWTEARRGSGADPREIVEGLRRLGDREIRDAGGDDDLVRRYELAVGYETIVQGLLRHLGRARGDGAGTPAVADADRPAGLDALLAGVAHDLSNPLAAIKSFAQLLLLDERPPEDREALEAIEREAARAAEIVAGLRRKARPGGKSGGPGGTQPPRPE